MNVLIVDDDVANRAGVSALLAIDPNITVIGAVDHDAALERRDWDDIDTVVLDAGNTTDPVDQVPGAVVAMHIRKVAGPERPTIIVVTQFSRADNVALRMRAAGADYLYDRAWLMQSSERLCEHVHAPDYPIPELRHPEVVEELGLTPRSDPNEIVAVIKEVIVERGVDPAYLDVDHERRPQVPGSTPSRSVRDKLRARVARKGAVEPRRTDGNPHREDVDDPPLPHIRRLWTYLTKLDR